VRVERDTTLPFLSAGGEMLSSSGVRPGPHDSLLATPTTPMPAARVRLLQLDSATRTLLAANGVRASEPMAFIKAAPYRADCRTIRWTDTVPFVVPGEVGYVRALLAPREQWVNGLPLLVIPDAWNYPYPRRRSIAYGAPAGAALASAEAMFSLNAALERPVPGSEEGWKVHREESRERALAWARANRAVAELEPVRRLVHDAVLHADAEELRSLRSRLRGSYRVEMDVAGGARGTWFFRTDESPTAPWRGRDTMLTTAQLVSSPHVRGYQLIGYAASSPDSLQRTIPDDLLRSGLVWLSMPDRPTTPGNETRRVLEGELAFFLGSIPDDRLWSDFEEFGPPRSARDSVFAARSGRTIPRTQTRVRLPLTLRLDAAGAVRGDTTLALSGGRSLRVVLERIDTLSVPRPF
jgi:hypothetical protein